MAWAIPTGSAIDATDGPAARPLGSQTGSQRESCAKRRSQRARPVRSVASGVVSRLARASIAG
jgi:hypothetical protein